MIEAYRASFSFTYTKLGEVASDWEQDPRSIFGSAQVGLDNFPDLRSWSNGFNSFDNWVNLSHVTTIASNIEIYLGSMVKLALDSNPGVLIGAPSRSIDGAQVLKYQTGTPIDYAPHIESFTKGDWSSRLSAIERLFGTLPQTVKTHHADLETIRKIRNRFGHAFGRDIDESRKHGDIHISPVENLSRPTLGRLGRSGWRFVKALDKFFLDEHVGDFEAVNFYAQMFPSQLAHVPSGQRAVNFKKEIGRFGVSLRGKVYCKGLVDYWEAL